MRNGPDLDANTCATACGIGLMAALTGLRRHFVQADEMES